MRVLVGVFVSNVVVVRMASVRVFIVCRVVASDRNSIKTSSVDVIGRTIHGVAATADLVMIVTVPSGQAIRAFRRMYRAVSLAPALAYQQHDLFDD